MQVVLPFISEGGIAKMVSNKLAVGPGGQWVLPFMRTGSMCAAA